MSDQEYWRKRSEEIAGMQFDKSDEYAAKLEKEYEKAVVSIQRDLEVFYERYAENVH